MTCARNGCQNPIDAANGKYCSREHAPYGNLSNESSFRSVKEQLERSGIAERGARSMPSLHVASVRDIAKEKESPRQELRPSGLNVPNNQRSDTIKSAKRDESETTMGIEKHGTLGMNETRLTIAEKKPLEETSETPLATFEPQSTISGQDGSRSMSLIDGSVKLMHGLLKSVAGQIQTESDLGRITDPRTVGAACNVAKQMGQLLRLKLEWAKEARKAFQK